MRFPAALLACLALAAALLGALPAAAPAPAPATPADAVRAALADARTLPPGLRVYARYLDLAHLDDPAALDRAVRVLGGHVNGLSDNPVIVPPAELYGGRLLRVLTTDYGWQRRKFRGFKDVWEGLADQDPYYHQKLVAEVFTEYERTNYQGHEWVREPGGPWTLAGEWKKGKGFKTRKETVGAAAAWLPAGEIAELVALTQSQAPIVRGDWFFQQTALAVDRQPNYYDFLGIKDEKTFWALVAFDAKKARDFGAEWKEAVARSGVNIGRQPRRLERFEKIGGALWLTKDSRIAKDKFNPLRVLDDTLLFDATEQFGHLSNGVLAWFLGNNQGVKQDNAPDFIASDQAGAANDSRVHVNLSCIRCHSDGGVKDFSGWARQLFKLPAHPEREGAVGLFAADKEKLRELQAWYLRPLEDGVADDRKRHARAVALATRRPDPRTGQPDRGLAAAEYAAEYYALWRSYAEADVTLQRAARELGTTPAALVAALRRVATGSGGPLDTVLSNWLKPPAEQQPLQVGTWEELYPLAQLALLGIVP